MDSTLVQLSIASVGLVPVVLALTSLIKIYVDSRWSPLISLVLGIASAFIFPSTTIALTILQGLLIGLSASGLYSGVKATVQG